MSPNQLADESTHLLPQSNNNRPNPNGPHFVPMKHLTDHQRKHRLLIALLLGVFLLILTSLALWRLTLYSPDQVDPGTQTTPALKAQYEADRSLQLLNHHHHRDKKNLTQGCEATVLILRHCEKYGNTLDEHGDAHCSYIGYQRAAFLPTLFGTRWPLPSALLSMTTIRGQHSNFREVETLRPLSKLTGVPIELMGQSTRAVADSVFETLRRGDLCGKLVVLCWKHEHIPKLSNHLGCGPQDGCLTEYPETTFDQVWELKYVFEPPMLQDAMEEPTSPLDEDGGRRRLKKKHQGGWLVYGFQTYQRFDPLEHSHAVGDYPERGTESGGRWIDEL